MQGPGDDEGVHVLGSNELEQLIGGEALGDNDEVVPGFERRSQALFKLLVAQAERYSDAERTKDRQRV